MSFPFPVISQVGEICSLSGYAQHVCLLLGISHFNAGALVFCDGRNTHKLTRDTEYSVVLQDTHSTRLHDAEYYTDKISMFIDSSSVAEVIM